MNKNEARVAKLEGKLKPAAEPLLVIWNPMNADNGKPAADQGELVAIRNLRDDSRIVRRKGEEEDVFRERVGQEHRERCAASGQALPMLLEDRE